MDDDEVLGDDGEPIVDYPDGPDEGAPDEMPRLIHLITRLMLDAGMPADLYRACFYAKRDMLEDERMAGEMIGCLTPFREQKLRIFLNKIFKTDKY